MQFEREIIVPLPPEVVWSVLWDIERMVACVPGCVEAVVVEEKRRYKALIVDKVGPFKIEIPLDIEIGAIDAARSMRLRATGKDKYIGTEINWDLALELKQQGDNTHCCMTVDAEIVGRLVSLGQGVIKLKGKQSINRFADALLASLMAENEQATKQS